MGKVNVLSQKVIRHPSSLYYRSEVNNTKRAGLK
jgi:hypothetical protein